MNEKQAQGWRIAMVGALAAYASIFSAFTGFVGLTWTLLASSLLLSIKAVGTRRIRQFIADFIGA